MRIVAYLDELDLPGADAFYARCLSLPLFPTMSDFDIATLAWPT